jgi:hypothetical protein
VSRAPARGIARRVAGGIARRVAGGIAGRLKSRLQRPEVRLRGLWPRHRCAVASTAAGEAGDRLFAAVGGLKPAAETAGSPPSRTAPSDTVAGAGFLPRSGRSMHRRALTARPSLPCSSGEGQALSGARERARGGADRTVPSAGILPRSRRSVHRRMLAARPSLPCSSGEGQAYTGATGRAVCARERARGAAERTVPSASILPRGRRGMHRRVLAARPSLPCSSGEGQAHTGATGRAVCARERARGAAECAP